MSNKFKIQLDVNNIGPHFGEHSITFKDSVDSNKAVFYALNGTGKTFISRAIRLSETIPQQFNASKILSMNKTAGELSFVVDADNVAKSLDVKVELGKEPEISNSLDLLFHVFNSDFVEENIKAKSYSPDGNIEGYILGKVQIDLSEERHAEATLNEEIESLDSFLDNRIIDARKTLQEEGVQPNTSEMRLISKEKIEENQIIEVEDTFEQCKAKLEELKNMPEDIPDLKACSYSETVGVLDDSLELLKTKYPQSSWDEEFVIDFQKKRLFIEKGLEYSVDDMRCPFCGRSYDDESLEMIRQYRMYLTDKQAQIQKQITDCRKKLQSVIEEKENFVSKCKSLAGELSEVSRYFPSLREEKINIPKIEQSLYDMFSEIDSLLEKKSHSLADVFEENPKWKDFWLESENSFIINAKDNNRVIMHANKVKNNANGERLSLRRELCKIKYNELCISCKEPFLEIKGKESELRKLQASIRNKEQQARVSKKDKVFETLTYLLNQFFFEKYTIDSRTFEIQFHGNNLGKEAGNYLSDGEKGIVAFCLYLAYVHQLVETEEDYEKLFFVIDDPISSMDFNYVYAVAQTLREIKKLYNISKHERVWVLTHNLEFLSIIARNHVLPNVYLITPGNIEKYNYKLLMPYESHLRDVVCIANGYSKPSHTTGNSIRHIIETIAKFEDPQIALDRYIQNDEILCSNSVVYSLCQDLSHGNMRFEKPYTIDIMRSACKTVNDFVRSKYPEQIKNVLNNAKRQ